MPELIVYLRDRELMRKPILAVETVIGRDANCDVVLDNAGVSRKHAMIVLEKDRFMIRDAGSQNGFSLNGKTAEESELRDGDVVKINKFEVRFAEAGGVPKEFLNPPKQAVGSGPANVVATMTVNADAARRLHEQLMAKKAASQPEMAGPGPRRGLSPRFPMTAAVAVAALVASLYFLVVR